jgi:hypothetical protein
MSLVFVTKRWWKNEKVKAMYLSIVIVSIAANESICNCPPTMKVLFPTSKDANAKVG